MLVTLCYWLIGSISKFNEGGECPFELVGWSLSKYLIAFLIELTDIIVCLLLGGLTTKLEYSSLKVDFLLNLVFQLLLILQIQQHPFKRRHFNKLVCYLAVYLAGNLSLRIHEGGLYVPHNPHCLRLTAVAHNLSIHILYLYLCTQIFVILAFLAMHIK